MLSFENISQIKLILISINFFIFIFNLINNFIFLKI